jgi:hypothetical protein
MITLERCQLFRSSPIAKQSPSTVSRRVWLATGICRSTFNKATQPADDEMCVLSQHGNQWVHISNGKSYDIAADGQTDPSRVHCIIATLIL